MRRLTAIAQSLSQAMAGGFFFTVSRPFITEEHLEIGTLSGINIAYWGYSSLFMLLLALAMAAILQILPSAIVQKKPSKIFAFWVLVIIPSFAAQGVIALSVQCYDGYQRITLALSFICCASLPMLVRKTLTVNR